MKQFNKCLIKGCESVKKKGTTCSFHEIPANIATRKLWLKTFEENNVYPVDASGSYKQITDYSLICERHFLPEDYETGRKRRVLKKTAVPSIFRDLESETITIDKYQESQQVGE